MQTIEENLIEQAPQPQIQELPDEQQPLILNDQGQEIPNDQLPDDQQQQPLIEDNQAVNLAPEEIPGAQQQQQQNIPRQHEQLQEQEPQIPDEVRQMPDAQQQQALREMFREELHKFQRHPKNNNMNLLPIFISVVVIITAAFLLKPPLDYVSRREFEIYKIDNQNGLVAVRENSRKSISEHEAKIVNFGKHWEEILASFMRTNATRELPDKSIENLLQAAKKVENEVSRLRKEVSDLQAKNTKLQKSFEGFETRFRKLESKSGQKQAHALTTVTAVVLILTVLF